MQENAKTQQPPIQTTLKNFKVASSWQERGLNFCYSDDRYPTNPSV
jgi:hypothetical protein